MLPQSSYITRVIELALDEDAAKDDVTSRVAIPPGLKGKASLIAKEDLIFCSGGIIKMIIDCAEINLTVRDCIPDGSRVSEGAVLAIIEGMTADILTLERTILNFVQRLSGVATKTSEFVAAAGLLTVLDTRKTTPGWRLLEKYAVTVGGGKNHRMNLGDLILIKNNHIDAHKGDLKSLFEQVYSQKPPSVPVEVEVRSMNELQGVLAQCTPDFIMLDNMNDSDIRTCTSYIHLHAPTIKVEISGGMTIDRLKALSNLSILVSIGALTTQARCVDISLRIHG